MTSIAAIFLLLFTGVAAFIDVATKKIPNKLNLLGLGAVILLMVFRAISFPEAIYASVITFLGFLLLYVFNVFGAGNVKLMGVAAAPVPLIFLPEFIFLSCLFAAATGLIIVIMRGDGRHILLSFKSIFLKIKPFGRRFLSGFSNKTILTKDKAGGRAKENKNPRQTKEERVSASVDLKTPFAQGVFLASLWMFGGNIMSLF